MSIFDSHDEDKIALTRTGRAPYQIELDLDDPPDGEFTFLVVGDSGEAGQAMLDVGFHMASEPAAFVLHLGDLVYLSGSAEGYPRRFIEPYQGFLTGGTGHGYSDMVFSRPFLPILGNHDYYDFAATSIGRKTLGELFGRIESVGSGSRNGQVFHEAFVEPEPERPMATPLAYVPSVHTRIPNRYYWFTYGGCAFYALDSNTLNGMEEVVGEERDAWKRRRREAEAHVDRIVQYLSDEFAGDGVNRPPESISREERELLEELAEARKEIEILTRGLEGSDTAYDRDQLAWLETVLRDERTEGKFKIVYMHHQLYTSEASHTNDPESLGLRRNLRRLFVDSGVHLVLSGHSHCFEWLSRRVDPGAPEVERRLSAAERRICYVVSGGGGRELRPSVLEATTRARDGIDLLEKDRVDQQLQFLSVAESRGFAEAHHYLRIDVTPTHLRVSPQDVSRGLPFGERRPLVAYEHTPSASEIAISKKTSFVTGRPVFIDHIVIDLDHGREPHAVGDPEATDPSNSLSRENVPNARSRLEWVSFAHSGEDRRWRAGVGPAVIDEGDDWLGRDPTSVEQVRVVSWNVRLGAGRLPEVLMEPLREAAQGGRPVVALLQEVAQHVTPTAEGRHRVAPWSPDTMRGPRHIEAARLFVDSVRELEHEVGKRLHVCYVPSMRNGEEDEPMRLPQDRGNAIVSTVPLNGIRAVVLPWVEQRRVAVLAKIELSQTILFGCVHLDVALASSGRKRQVAALGDLVATEQGPVLFAGDFNTIHGPETEGVIEELRKRGFTLPPSSDPHYTYTGVMPRQLDYMLLRPLPGNSIEYRVDEDDHGSDHRPLIGSLFVGEL